MKNSYDYLFLDFMVEDTHMQYANHLINCLNETGTSIVVEKKNAITYMGDEKHKVIYIETGEIVGNYPIKARVNTYYNYLNSLKSIKNYKFKKVFILGYDPVMFMFMYKKLLSIGEVYLIEHHQLDEVDISPIKYKLWNKYKNKCHHILLDPSIKDAVIKRFEIRSHLVHTFPHPLVLNDLLNKEENCYNDYERKVLCISNSIKEDDVKKLVEIERNTALFKNNKIKLVIRENNSINIDNLNSIEMIPKYVSDEQYEILYKESNLILIAYPLSFKYRCSGMIIDALASKKKIITSKIMEGVDYAQRFPHLCISYNNIEEIPDIIINNLTNYEKDEWKEFIKYQEQIKVKGIEELIKVNE